MEQFLIAFGTSFVGAVVAQAVTRLARAFFPRLEGWFRRKWKNVVALLAILALEGVGLVFTVGGAAGVAALIDEYVVELPSWALILAAIVGGFFYVVRRVGLPGRLRNWAAKAGKATSGAQAKPAPKGRLREHDGVLWEEIGVIDLNNPFRRFGAGGPLCLLDHVRLGYEDPATMRRVAVARDDHMIGGVAGGRLYCPLCDAKYQFKTGVNPAIGKPVRESRKEAESILDAERQ